MVDENHQNMSKGGCKLSHHAIQIVKIVPCRPCPWKTGKLGRNNTCHKFVLAWKQWKSCMQTGTFSQHLGWVFIGPCHPSAHGPPVDELRKNALHWNEKTLRNRARHTHTRIYLHAYMEAYMHASIHCYVDIYLHTLIDAYIHPRLHTCLHTYVHTSHTQTIRRTCIHPSYMHTCRLADIPTVCVRNIHAGLHTYMDT